MEGEDLKKVTRINLKTHCSDRKALIDYCLHRKGEQKLAIGWSYLHEENGHSRSFVSYRDFYKAVRARVKRINHALNVFWYAKEGETIGFAVRKAKPFRNIIARWILELLYRWKLTR